MIINKKKHKLILTFTIHTICWLCVYLFFVFFLSYGYNNTEYTNKFSVFLMPVTIITTYFFSYFLIPKYLHTKKRTLFILYSVYTFIISTFFIILSVFYAIIFSKNLLRENIPALTKPLPIILLSVYFIILTVTMLNILVNDYNSELKNKELKNRFINIQLKLKEQELKYLKSQIHPHFLFNTLNTIYGFALKQSQETPEIILKLSGLLDYILYHVNKPHVLLSDEINHIKNYCDLEKIRFRNKLDIQISETYFNSQTYIPPMLLLPFIENAFKHGKSLNGKLIISISIKTDKEQLYFSCKNSINKNTTTSKEGIGLENLKNRLNMLYGIDYTLKTNSNTDFYIATLKIPITHD